jgi:hypothetical protein
MSIWDKERLGLFHHVDRLCEGIGQHDGIESGTVVNPSSNAQGLSDDGREGAPPNGFCSFSNGRGGVAHQPQKGNTIRKLATSFSSAPGRVSATGGLVGIRYTSRAARQTKYQKEEEEAN